MAQAEYHRDWPLYDYVFYPPPLRLESRKLLWRDLQSIDVASRWREDWQSAMVVNSTLMVDPTVRLPGFDLHRRQWSLLNRFWTGQGHCNACHKKWGMLEYSFPRLFVPWNIRSHDGTFVLRTIRSLEHSFPVPFVPETEYYAENSFP